MVCARGRDARAALVDARDNGMRMACPARRRSNDARTNRAGSEPCPTCSLRVVARTRRSRCVKCDDVARRSPNAPRQPPRDVRADGREALRDADRRRARGSCLASTLSTRRSARRPRAGDQAPRERSSRGGGPGNPRPPASGVTSPERVGSLGCARGAVLDDCDGQGREPDAPAALGEASPDRVYGMVGQLAGCGWSIRIPVFGVPAGR